MTDKFVGSIERYRLATLEWWRRAYAALAAADIRAGRRQGFGVPIAVTELRHARANPDEGGSLADDIAKLL